MPTRYVDPVSGDNGNGGTAWGDAWQTTNGKALSAGDEVLYAKSAETGQSGTITVTNGSRSATTTVDLSGSLSVDDVLRIDDGAMIYAIGAISVTDITFTLPFAESSGAGLSFTKVTVVDMTALVLMDPSGNGTAANPIKHMGGINTGDDEQDGFTVIKTTATSGSVELNTLNYHQVSRIGAMDGGTYIGTFSGADYFEITECYFHCSASSSGLSLTGYNGLLDHVHIQGEIYGDMTQHLFTDCIIGDASRIIDSSLKDCTFIRCWFDSETYGNIAPAAGDVVIALFIDCEFNMWTAGEYAFEIYGHSIYFDVRCINCLFSGAGILKHGQSSYGGYGKIVSERHDQTDNDERVVFPDPHNDQDVTLTRETTVFRTSSPSARVDLNEFASALAICHEAAVSAIGSQQTITAYLRKNAAYGGDNRPALRVRYIDGSDDMQEVTDVMSDVDDLWEQVSCAFTPGRKQVQVFIDVESSVNGALAYYDDITVS